ncbi:MAG: ABC transporter permease [Nanoarchaeota archaeon]|nr:ABC transporter permease [Nanoarchaeota archaeon]MBU1644193.1 ABC transporter permease [Nanoarchaeota archaeon]MBU1977349.1 ABC transporter permease [Nanoarchaeota archaeon]
MKLLKIILKNFKVLLRSKSSAFVVLVGPLLMIALISLAFSNSQEYDLAVGIIAPDQEGMTGQFITHLEKEDYRLVYYDIIDQCIQDIKLNTVNICITFPENFVIGNEAKPEVEFYADQSRINLVESIISSISSTISLGSDEITLKLTNTLLDAINLTSQELEKEKSSIKEINSAINSGFSNSNKIESDSAKANFALAKIKPETAQVSNSSKKLENETEALFEDLEDLLNEITASNYSDLVEEHYDNLNGFLSTENGKIDDSLEEIESLVDSISVNIGINKSSGIIASITKVKTDLTTIKTNLDKIEKSVQATTDEINQIEITSASSIVNPFTIKVNPILSTTDRSTFMFPYFITLIILFVGIMLSSTLVVMEKKSQAFFRTFTTPTSESTQIFAGYITSITVLILQLAIVFLGAHFYLKMPLFKNYQVTLLVLFLSLSFFTLLGSVIGYMFKTQEGTTIASISLGSLFIFLSNLVLPVESFPQVIRNVLMFNPFVLCSEMFKKSMLFSVSLLEMKQELLIILSYIIIVTTLVIIFHKMSFNRMFSGFANRKILRKPHITKENYFKLRDGTDLKDKNDLLEALKKMDDEEFRHYVNKENNEIALWIKETFKEKKLARLIKKLKNRESIIDALHENLDITPEEKFQEEEKIKKKRLETRRPPQKMMPAEEEEEPWYKKIKKVKFRIVK